MSFKITLILDITIFIKCDYFFYVSFMFIDILTPYFYIGGKMVANKTKEMNDDVIKIPPATRIII